MSKTYYAMGPGEERVIRGKVQSAYAVVKCSGQDTAYIDLPENLWPFQTNNMSAWLTAVMKQANTVVRRAVTILTKEDGLDYLVNNGAGRLQGRGSNQNVFTYKGVSVAEGVSLEITLEITTVSYTRIWQNKVRAGEHTPTPRVKHQPKQGDRQKVGTEWQIYDANMGMWFVDPNQED